MSDEKVSAEQREIQLLNAQIDILVQKIEENKGWPGIEEELLAKQKKLWVHLIADDMEGHGE